MRTITVTLPDDIADEVERFAAAGEWDELKDFVADDVTAYALRDGRFEPLTHAELKREIDRGIEDSEQGRLVDGEEFMARWLAKIDERAK